MQLPFKRLRGSCSLLLLALLAVPSYAQPEKVKFETVDGVEIRGTFYTGKGRAPVVMLLHAYENHSRAKEWIGLADSLQKAGYSVLAFDFRGHGESLTIDPGTFFKFTPNAAGMKNAKAVHTRGTLEFKDFKPEYRNILVNDIAAAKAFLDRKNDTGACNTGATILIGAEEGATLGAIWANSEMYRYRLVPNMFMGMMPDKEPEGRDLCACMWLTISPKLGVGSHSFSLAKTLYLAGAVQETPMLFLHGDNDTEGKKRAMELWNYLKDKKVKGKPKFTKAIGIPETNLTGSALLKTSGADKAVIEWLDEVVVAKAKEWQERDFRKTQYVWRTAPGGGLVPAKTMVTELNMAYETYIRYMAK